MGWKLFALFVVVLTGWSFVGSDSYGPTTVVNLTMSAVSAAGLVLMAFKIELFPRAFWRAFAAAYAVYSLVLVGSSGLSLYKQYAIDGRSLSVVASAFLVMATFQIAISMGLWVNASNWRTGETGV